MTHEISALLGWRDFIRFHAGCVQCAEKLFKKS